MKTLKLIALTAFALLFSQCKTTSPTAPTGPAPSLLEVKQILDSAQSKFLAYSVQNNGNPHLSIMQTTSWVQSQPSVKSATALDSIYITIVLKSGLRTTFSFDEVDSAGYSLFKGGGAGVNDIPITVSGLHSKNTITNKKVLIYCAGCSEFYKNNEIQQTVDLLTASNVGPVSGLGLDVTLLQDAECTYPIVDNFKDYGLVIIDTHGMPDAFMIGPKIQIDNPIVSDDLFKASIITQVGQATLDKLLSGELTLHDRVKGNMLTPYWKKVYPPGSKFNLLLTSKYIDQLPQMPGTVIMGSMCYSGWANDLGTGYTPIKTSFINKNPISYYCFAFNNGSSDAVGSGFAKNMEDALAKAFVIDFDSTKIANLKPDHQSEYFDPQFTSPKLYFRHFGADDYSYEGCVGTLYDIRDERVYNTACIGKQVWMAENLDFDVSGGDCYDNDTNNCKKFGKLYDFQTALAGQSQSNTNPSRVRGICPMGWHLPSASEWDQLIAFVGGAKSGKALESTTYGGTNSSGFNGLAAGRVAHDYHDKPVFDGISSMTIFTTSSLIHYTINNVDVGPAYISAPYVKASCRCVKDP